MTEDNRRRNSQKEWQLAEEAWEDAELLRSAGRWRAAVTRYYYSSFHSARAAVLTRGLEPRTHSGLKALFSQHFVHTDLLAPSASRHLSRLETEREDADYSRESVFTQADAEAAREASLGFREALATVLRQEGWLS